MSFKGFQKAIVRAPQSFRQKMNMGEVTNDPVYADAERRFKELEIETKKLSDESKRYFSAVNGMLDYQIDFSKAIEEIYKPISGRLSDPNSIVQEDNPQGIEASEAYRAVVAELKETLKPDLELIETRIVGPAQELLKVIQSIRKMATKRDHKQVDLDRYKRNHKKYEDKKERTAKDEEKMYGAEAEVQIAQQEYDYYNDMLKQELPILFQMQADFIKPLFVSFYYMQLNIFYTLFNRMEELKIPYFDLSTDILEAFTYKKGNIDEQADMIGITHFKVGHARNKLEMTKRRYAAQAGAPGSDLPGYTPPPGQYGAPAAGYGDYKSPDGSYGAPAYGQPAAYGAPAGAPAYGQPASPATSAPAYGGYGAPASPATAAAPAYGGYGTPASPTPAAVPAYGGYATPAASASSYGAPPAPAAPAAPAGETCTALYDYAAQAQGDLSFAAGTVIEIVERTADVNGWWTGRANGQTGVFPGNYVQLN